MNKVYVAKLGKTVGLQGHLRLFIDSDFPEQFKKGAIFTTNRNLILKVLLSALAIKIVIDVFI